MLTALKYHVMVAFCLCFTGLLQAQHIGRINFTEIKENIENPTGEYYYPSLQDRILKHDTTLVYKHYKHLYYGCVFQDSYHPYGNSNAKKEFLDTYEVGNYDSAIVKGKAVLRENPVDIEVTLKLILAYLESGDTASAKLYGRHYFAFLDVIYASGDGLTQESAYVVISVDDEYRIVGDLGLNVKQQELLNGCDLLIFVKRGQRKFRKKPIRELYFNVQMPLMSLSKSFKDTDLPDPDNDSDDDE